MKKITSTKNGIIVELSKLKNSKYRKTSELFCAEGYKLTKEVLLCGLEVVYHFVSDTADINKFDFELNEDLTYIVSEHVMKKISSMTSPPEILTVAKQPQYDYDCIKDDIILALDCIQDPSNIGAIARSAEAFGVTTILLGNGCCDAYSQKTLRAAMGSIFRLNILSVDLQQKLSQLQSQGFTVIGTGLDRNYQTVDKLSNYSKKIIVIGNEGSGISDTIKDCCDFGMFIPMSGKNESLNAAVAASIILWENQRQNNE